MPGLILLKNGRVIDPANGIDQLLDLLIAGGRISAVAQPGSLAEQSGCLVYDLAGKWVVPGLIDMHVHLREPGQEDKETIATGTRAAAAGGFTAVAAMPNTNPVNDNQTVTLFILAKAAEAGFARVYPVGAISRGSKGEHLAEFGELRQAGAVAVTDDGLPVGNSQLMRRALEYAGNHDLLVISHAEELSLSHSGTMNHGALATRLGLGGIPSVAEEIMVYRDLALAEFTRRPIHIAHVSTKESLSLIRRAKEKGVAVTAETAPHYFTLTETAVDGYNTLAKMNPPLRTEADVAAVREALRDGTLDAIATDHAPHSELDKEREFALAANGIIGLETAVPLTLRLVRENQLEARRMVELLSVNPARILGVEGGALSVGAAADVTVIDPEKKFIFSEESIQSKSRNSPFLGWELQGKAVLTIMAGKITWQETL
ncbi:MAG: dihydroorotase [Deltaproteobacteria bacterium RIFOXYD12_FULL_55_16]|nr:MAG: dihydroorotase [Deltaproteobacteria bacterium RIFOXYD12_FULL_55_16]